MHILNELLSGYTYFNFDAEGDFSLSRRPPTSKDIRAAKTIHNCVEEITLLQSLLQEHGIPIPELKPLFHNTIQGDTIDV